MYEVDIGIYLKVIYTLLPPPTISSPILISMKLYFTEQLFLDQVDPGHIAVFYIPTARVIFFMNYNNYVLYRQINFQLSKKILFNFSKIFHLACFLLHWESPHLPVQQKY